MFGFTLYEHGCVLMRVHTAGTRRWCHQKVIDMTILTHMGLQPILTHRFELKTEAVTQPAVIGQKSLDFKQK